MQFWILTSNWREFDPIKSVVWSICLYNARFCVQLIYVQPTFRLNDHTFKVRQYLPIRQHQKSKRRKLLHLLNYRDKIIKMQLRDCKKCWIIRAVTHTWDQSYKTYTISIRLPALQLPEISTYLIFRTVTKWWPE